MSDNFIFSKNGMPSKPYITSVLDKDYKRFIFDPDYGVKYDANTLYWFDEIAQSRIDNALDQFEADGVIICKYSSYHEYKMLSLGRGCLTFIGKHELENFLWNQINTLGFHTVLCALNAISRIKSERNKKDRERIYQALLAFGENFYGLPDQMPNELDEVFNSLQYMQYTKNRVLTLKEFSNRLCSFQKEFKQYRYQKYD